MAQKATIYKASIDIADMNRNYYQSHAFTVALHPSETEQRLLVRLIAFALNAQDDLTFTKGISTDTEPDLWVKSLTDEKLLWIEIGQISEDRIRKACNQSKQVILYVYQDRNIQPWWQKVAPKLQRFRNLTVYQLRVEPMEALLERTMQLQCTIQDNILYLSNKNDSFECTLTQLNESSTKRALK